MHSSVTESGAKSSIIGAEVPFKSLRLRFRLEKSKDSEIKDMLLEAIKKRDFKAVRILSKAAPGILIRAFDEIYEVVEKSQSPKLALLLLCGIDKRTEFHRLEMMFNRAIPRNSEVWVYALAKAARASTAENGKLAKLCGVSGSEKSLHALLAGVGAQNSRYIFQIAFLESIQSGNTQMALNLIKGRVLENWVAGVDLHYQGRERDHVENDENAVFLNSKDPLIIAINNDNPRVVDAILDRTKLDFDQLHFALRAACRRENSAIFRSLRDRGADIDYNNGEILDAILKSGDKFAQLGFYITEGATLKESHFSQRSGKVGTFLEVVAPLVNGEAKNSIKEVRAALPEGVPRIIKTDAISEQGSFQQQPIVSTFIRSAVLSCVLGRFNHTDVVAYLKSLLTEDIKRVEETKGLSWKRYVNGLEEQRLAISTFEDVIKEVAETLVLPVLIDKDPYQRRTLAASQVMAIELATRLICEEKSTLDILVLNAKWHRAGNRCPDDLRPYLLIGDWAPLFDRPVEVSETYTVECLNTPNALRDEGSALSHCVGGYSQSCRNGDTQILSVRNNGVSQATVELSRADNGEIAIGNTRWTVRQFKGAHNKAPPRTAETAFEQFKLLTRENKIEVAKSFVKREQVKNDEILEKISAAERIFGFDLSETAKVRTSLLAHYDERVFVERGKKRIALFAPAARARLEAWAQNPEQVELY